MPFKRYSEFLLDDKIEFLPFIKLKRKNSDKEFIYQRGITRFDILSDKFYKDANYGWIILLANSEYGSLEFNIPDNTKLRIPFPLETTLNDYKEEVNKYVKYYGIKNE